MRKKASKPIGAAGTTRITKTELGHRAEFRRAEFTSDKEEIEEDILRGFLLSAKDSLPALSDPPFKRNQQDDFDFDLHLLDDKIKFMELKEFAPLAKGSYESASSKYFVGNFVELIRRMVLKLSKRYRSSVGDGLYLLLYVTDWRFTLSQSTLNSLRYWFLLDDHCFERIYIYHVRERFEGLAEVLYPDSVPADFDPRNVRDNQVTNLDPKKMIDLPGGGIGWKVP